MLAELTTLVTLASDNKPATDGLTTDLQNNIWMTAVEHSGATTPQP
jgi:hypothetical protein